MVVSDRFETTQVFIGAESTWSKGNKMARNQQLSSTSVLGSGFAAFFKTSFVGNLPPFFSRNNKSSESKLYQCSLNRSYCKLSLTLKISISVILQCHLSGTVCHTGRHGPMINVFADGYLVTGTKSNQYLTDTLKNYFKRANCPFAFMKAHN